MKLERISDDLLKKIVNQFKSIAATDSEEDSSSHKTMKLVENEQLETAVYKWYVQKSVGLLISSVT